MAKKRRVRKAAKSAYRATKYKNPYSIAAGAAGAGLPVGYAYKYIKHKKGKKN